MSGDGFYGSAVHVDDAGITEHWGPPVIRTYSRRSPNSAPEPQQELSALRRMAEYQRELAETQRRKNMAKKAANHAALDNFDKLFLKTLPPQDRPDYIEPSPKDEADSTTVQRSDDGYKTYTVTTYKTRDGRRYTITSCDRPISHVIRHKTYMLDITNAWETIERQRAARKKKAAADAARRSRLAKEKWQREQEEYRQEKELRKKRSIPLPRDQVPEDELKRFYGRGKMADPMYFGQNRFDMHVDSDKPGQCDYCGKFKAKTSLGYYFCKETYFKSGWWEHR